ncbi:MAG: PHP domain-containing protein [Prolixibacteraceae bacterium]|jgi:predicted metal-dependent phosphoesterase TrpH|nr:PHP domain-containing protein [Prolixibacteraceae bacterium]
MRSKKIIFAIVLFVPGLFLQVRAQLQNADVHEFPAMSAQNYRYYINIPNIGGYETMKCDFHMHTVFSDGHVWPAMRVSEAWNEGLDAIAITDHIEYRPNKAIIHADLNKSNEIAQKKGDEIGLIVIKGTEITRKKPLGHINALFVQDVNKLDLPNELDAIDEAVKQGAYLLWNHPGWPNDTSTLYPVHQELIAQKKLHGVEVFNSWEYYPKVLDWCNQYGLAHFANTDLHYTSSNAYRERCQRPMTLVFTKERSAEGIKEALFAGRTIACYNNYLAGKESLLKELIHKSISVKVINREKSTIEVFNQSDLPYSIRSGEYMYSIPLFANQVLRINIPSGTDVTFTNCFIGQDQFVTLKLW